MFLLGFGLGIDDCDTVKMNLCKREEKEEQETFFYCHLVTEKAEQAVQLNLFTVSSLCFTASHVTLHTHTHTDKERTIQT